jgi:hypothetical protein
MLLMTSNTRSGDVGQGREAPRSGRSEAQSLDGRRSGGYSASDAQGLCFVVVHAQQPPRLHGTTTERRFFLLVADSIHAHAQQPVNASVFAVPGCRPLIPITFPNSNFRLLCSSHSGVTCHPTPDAEGSALLGEHTGDTGRVFRLTRTSETVDESFWRPPATLQSLAPICSLWQMAC